MKLRKIKKKGETTGPGAIVGAFTIGAVLILFLWINSIFKSSIDRSSWTAEENTTYTKVTGNVNQAFNLGAIFPIVLIVVAVVGAILLIARAF